MQQRRVLRLICTALGLTSLTACVADASLAFDLSAAELRPMASGVPMPPPIQYRDFCAREPDECSVAETLAGLPRSRDELVAELIAVNDEVNTTVRWAPDAAIYGAEDVWATTTDVGDCEDAVLTKRKHLRQLGWPLDSLRLTLVLLPPLRMHAVLLARTPEGDLVLDTRYAKPMPWHAAPYVWFAREGATSEKWELLAGLNSKLAAERRMVQASLR